MSICTYFKKSKQSNRFTRVGRNIGSLLETIIVSVVCRFRLHIFKVVFFFFLQQLQIYDIYFKGEGSNKWFSSHFDQNHLPELTWLQNTLANVCDANSEWEGGIADNSLRSLPQSWQLVWSLSQVQQKNKNVAWKMFVFTRVSALKMAMCVYFSHFVSSDPAAWG